MRGIWIGRKLWIGKKNVVKEIARSKSKETSLKGQKSEKRMTKSVVGNSEHVSPWMGARRSNCREFASRKRHYVNGNIWSYR